MDNSTRTANLRLQMCHDFCEGTEIGDAVEALLHAIDRLQSIGNTERADVVLVLAEGVCRDYVTWLQNECSDYDDYQRFPDKVFEHFSGEKKLSKKKFLAECENYD